MALQPGLSSLNGVSWKLYLFMDYYDDKEENLKGVSHVTLQITFKG